MACHFALAGQVASLTAQPRRPRASRTRVAPVRAAQRETEPKGRRCVGCSAAMRVRAGAVHVVCLATACLTRPPSASELLLNSSSTLVLASIFHFSGERPRSLGLQRLGASQTLGLCPRTPNCISTAEEANDPGHYVPPWTYNTEELRVRKGQAAISREEAMAQLVEAVKSTKPDGFTPTIVKQAPDYLYVEYESPLFGFVDDVEFYFPDGDGSRVEYRSASRLGQSDGDVNRKRIRTLREALQKKGWRSVGY